MSDYTYVFVGGSRQIPVLVPVEIVVERMIASAEKYRILSDLSSAKASNEDDEANEEPLFV